MRNASDTYSRATSLSLFSLSLSFVCWTSSAPTAEREREREGTKSIRMKLLLNGEQRKRPVLMLIISRNVHWWFFFRLRLNTPRHADDDDRNTQLIVDWPNKKFFQMINKSSSRRGGDFIGIVDDASSPFIFTADVNRETNVYHIDQWRSKVDEFSNVTAKTILEEGWKIVWKCRWAFALVPPHLTYGWHHRCELDLLLWTMTMLLPCLIVCRSTQNKFNICSSIFSQLNVIQSHWGQKMMM